MKDKVSIHKLKGNPIPLLSWKTPEDYFHFFPKNGKILPNCMLEGALDPRQRVSKEQSVREQSPP